MSRVAYTLAGVILGLTLVGNVGAQRSLQTLEKTTAAPLSNHWAKDRQADIQKCKAAGGLPVVLAGVVSSDGVGCARPLGD